MASNNTPTDQVVVIRAGVGPAEGLSEGRTLRYDRPDPAINEGSYPIAFACQHCGIRVSPAAASARQCKKQLGPTHAVPVVIGAVSLPAGVVLGGINSGLGLMTLFFITTLVCIMPGLLGCAWTVRQGKHCCNCLKEAGAWSTTYYSIRACRFCKKRAAGGHDEPSPRREYSFEQVIASTNQLLKSNKFTSASPDTQAGLLSRLELLKQAGIPPMKVLPMTKLVELGRIPHSSEGFAVDAATALLNYAEDRLSRPMAPIYFFSHRWLRPDWCEALQKNVAFGTEEREQVDRAGLRVGDPDDADATKARALIQVLRWFVVEHARTQARSWEEQCNREEFQYTEKPLEEVYLWIDWPCVDQSNKLPEIAALPAYVSCCSGIMAAYNETYMTRAWCRVEILNAFAFCGCNTTFAKDSTYFRYERSTLPEVAEC